MKAEEEPLNQASGSPRDAPSPRPTTLNAPINRPRPQALKDLVLPPELVKRVDEQSAQVSFWRRAKYRRSIEQDIKLQYFYGGQDVAHVSTLEGLVILFSGDGSSPEFQEFLDSLPRHERCQVTLWSLDPWNGTESIIGHLENQTQDSPG